MVAFVHLQQVLGTRECTIESASISRRVGPQAIPRIVKRVQERPPGKPSLLLVTGVIGEVEAERLGAAKLPAELLELLSGEHRLEQ